MPAKRDRRDKPDDDGVLRGQQRLGRHPHRAGLGFPAGFDLLEIVTGDAMLAAGIAQRRHLRDARLGRIRTSHAEMASARLPNDWFNRARCALAINHGIGSSHLRADPLRFNTLRKHWCAAE